jgi:hypothetical protein
MVVVLATLALGIPLAGCTLTFPQPAVPFDSPDSASPSPTSSARVEADDLDGEYVIRSAAGPDGPLRLGGLAPTLLLSKGTAWILTACVTEEIALYSGLEHDGEGAASSEPSNGTGDCAELPHSLLAAVSSLSSISTAERTGSTLVLTASDQTELTLGIVPTVAMSELDGEWSLTARRTGDAGSRAGDSLAGFTLDGGEISGATGCDRMSGTLRREPPLFFIDVPSAEVNTPSEAGATCPWPGWPRAERIEWSVKDGLLVHVIDGSLRVRVVASDVELRFERQEY